MDFKVSAKQSGNSVAFEVEATDTKDALHKAIVEAEQIFDYAPGAERVSVSVSPIKEKE